MREKAFVTQEIGSIQRPAWRQKLDGEVVPEWIAEALLWGERLGVTERDELANPKNTGLLQKSGKYRMQKEKERIVEIASLYVIRMFESAGLDRIFNGEQPRTEMYDFLAKNTDGISTAGVLNSFDANYFRKGIVEKEVRIRPGGIEFFEDEFNFVKKNTGKTVKPCLTGPYTMADWSYIEHYRKMREGGGVKPSDVIIAGRHDAILAFAKDVLNPIVRGLGKAGASVIQIDEPAAATREGESKVFAEALNLSFEGLPAGVEKAVHLCYSNYPALFPALADCKANSYLVEFTNHASPVNFKPNQVSPETFRIIELFKEYSMDVDVGVGVVDIHSDLIETPQVIRDRLLYAAKLIGDPSRVQVNPDCGLRTRRWHVAYAKLVNMVEGAVLARAEFGD
ncbi:MAG: hypothetical protein ABH863_02025 [Candidatus Micrarchaeota archaeon]